jgi:pimeloyl-ACP methyl ester carboxylesterase
MGSRSEEARELVRAATAGTGRESAIRMWRGLGAHDTRDRLGAVTAARSSSSASAITTSRKPSSSRNLVAGAELLVLPDAGHITNLHQPERFTAALERFLSRPSPTSR